LIKKLKRKKLPSIKRLRNKIDQLFNKYIRERDKACIITGETNALSCSHYYDKKNNPFLRWDERNAHAMTIKMHWLHHHGRAPDYALWMFENNSMEFMKQLAIDSKKLVKLNRKNYNDLLKYYQDKLDSL